MKYDITPVAKPRMTQKDKWSKRPAVLRYRAFCDECRLKGVKLPDSGAHVIFTLPMPKSWNKKKRREMCGQAHQQKPDVDNLAKSLLDALYKDDCTVWDLRVTKVWSEHGCIEIISGSDERDADRSLGEIGYKRE